MTIFLQNFLSKTTVSSLLEYGTKFRDSLNFRDEIYVHDWMLPAIWLIKS